MKNFLILGVFFAVLSCQCQNDNWEELNVELKKSVKFCEPCLEDFSKKRMGYLFNALDKSFETTLFKNLKFEKQLSFSLCDAKYEDEEIKGYYDCFYISELRAHNNEEANSIYSYIEMIPETTIYYKPPNYWNWFKKEDRIYLVYSNAYGPDTDEFKSIDNIVDQILIMKSN